MFRGLYQGIGPVVLVTLPSSGTFFTVYEAVRSGLKKASQRKDGTSPIPSFITDSAASGTAELVSCAIITPAEVIKQNAQMVRNPDHKSGSSTSTTSNATLQTLNRFRSNPLALWRGYSALALRNLPSTAIQYPIFEKLKETLRARRVAQGKRNPHSLVENGAITAVSAAGAGGIAAVLTNPIDVVKTRIMLAAAADDDAAATAASRRRKSTRTVVKEIIAERGVKGLFRGMVIRTVWTMFGAALYLSIYESGRVYLAQRRGEGLDIEDDLL